MFANKLHRQQLPDSLLLCYVHHNLQVSTTAASSSTAPTISSTPSSITGPMTTSNRTAATVQASVAAVSENAFKLTFSLDTPGVVKYLVVYGNMYARFGDRYVVFDNGVSLVSSSSIYSTTVFCGHCLVTGDCKTQRLSHILHLSQTHCCSCIGPLHLPTLDALLHTSMLMSLYL